MARITPVGDLYITICDQCNTLASVERIDGQLVINKCACVTNRQSQPAPPKKISFTANLLKLAKMSKIVVNAIFS